MPRLGTRKIYHLIRPRLEAEGPKVGRDELFGWMKAFGLLVAPRKRYVHTTMSKHWMRKYPNLLRDMEVNGPEQAVGAKIFWQQ